MDPRTIFNYKCHKCKRTQEPGDFGYNNQTKTKRVTCTNCNKKRTERDNYHLRDSRLLAEAELRTQAVADITPETTDEVDSRTLYYLPQALQRKSQCVKMLVQTDRNVSVSVPVTPAPIYTVS